MPSFTTQLPNLRVQGPIAKVKIMPSSVTIDELKKNGKEILSIEVTALIDTGASATAISTKVVAGLELMSRGITNIATPSSDSHQTNVYDVSLHLPNNVVAPVVQAIEAPLTSQNIDCLIGRDVLRHSVLIYVGYTNTFTLSF
jgi:predicted aspartyl protease